MMGLGAAIVGIIGSVSGTLIPAIAILAIQGASIAIVSVSGLLALYWCSRKGFLTD